MCTHAHTTVHIHVAWYICGGQRTARRSWFSSIMWVPGNEFSWSDLLPSAFTCWAFSPTQLRIVLSFMMLRDVLFNSCFTWSSGTPCPPFPRSHQYTCALFQCLLMNTLKSTLLGRDSAPSRYLQDAAVGCILCLATKHATPSTATRKVKCDSYLVRGFPLKSATCRALQKEMLSGISGISREAKKIQQHC